MEYSHVKQLPIAFLLILFLAFTFPMVFGQNMDAVGVKTGDWIKYNVIRIGPDSTAWTTLIGRAVWVKVEVQNVSGTIITVRETIRLVDGSDNVQTISWNLLDDTTLWQRFIIAKSLGPGDNVGRYTLWVNETRTFKEVDLALNNTALRSYGEVAREANVLKFSELVAYFEWWNNNTLEYYWDRESGFLLERIWQTRYVESGSTPMSTLKLEIADTNMWKMETESRPFGNQSWLLALVGLVATTASGTILLTKPHRKPKTNKGA